MRQSLFISMFIFAFSVGLKSQISKIDSLENLLANHPAEDTIKIGLLNEIAIKSLRSDLENTIIYANKADSLSKILKFPKGTARNLFVKGRYWNYKGKPDSAILYFEKALKIYTQIGDKKGITDVLTSMADVYSDQGNFLLSIDFYEKALLIYNESEDKKGIALCLGSIGTIYARQGNYPKALEYYQKNIVVSEELGDKDHISSSLSNIGTIYSDQGDFKKALEYHQKALKMNEEAGDKSGLAINLGNIGIVYSEQGNNLKAIDHFQKALEISKSLDNKYGIARYNSNIGNSFLEEKNHKKALEYFTIALHIYQELNAKEGASIVLGNIAELYILMEDYKHALEYADLCLVYANETNSLRRHQVAYDKLSKSYEGLRNFEKALQYKTLWAQVKDSIFNDSNTREITNLENQFAFEKEKQTIAHKQEKKDALLEAEMQQQKQIRNTFVGSSMIFLILAMIILWSLILKRKANFLLAEQKEEITTQAHQLELNIEAIENLTKFKDDLTQMLVHDLKSPLSTLMNLPKSDSKEEQKEMVRYSASKMQNLVMNILDVKKYEDAGLNIRRSEQNMIQLWENANTQLNYLSKQKNIRILSPNYSVITCQIDKELIERVFVNILSNALKYTPANGKIECFANEINENSVKFTIKDNGSGIDSKALNSIFDKYTQSGTKISYSTGLGLTFCKIAVEQHGGTIGINSALNTGTEVWFTLPEARFAQKETIQTIQPNQIQFKNSQQLKTFLPRFEQTDVFHYSKLKKILTEIRNQDLSDEPWVIALQSAINQTDETQFINLLNLLKNQN